ncbi:hypothetical protein GDO86_013482 [Hymenochirus boettgeri]|uniref:HMG box domain-containing protein n=1 Tax=Hymenochirus boettgeri TaxID=247094 RepID=A0A8T2IRI2_9PIPI|nr:hypothetical protein GDO86_013482 [Hymenochirus boettgeri]
MVSLLSRGVGGLLRSVVGYCCVQTNSNVLNGTSGLQCTTLRWFSKKQFSDDQPKRPMTAYFRFCVEKRPTFVKHHPGVKNIELTKMIALEWKGLPDSVKETYKAESRTEMLKYKEEMEAYRETLTPVQIEMQKEERRQRLVKRRSIQKKRTKMKNLHESGRRCISQKRRLTPSLLRMTRFVIKTR